MTHRRYIYSLVIACLILSCAPGDRVSGPSSLTAIDSLPSARGLTVSASYTESFTGSSGPLAGTWTQQRTQGTVNRNGAGVGIASVNGSELFAFWSGNAFNADQYSQTRIGGALSAGAQFVGVTARASGIGDGNFSNYAFYTDGTPGQGHTELDKVIRGARSLLRYFSTTFAPGDVIKISAVGTTITCYKNGVALGTFTDQSLASGSPGVAVYGNTVTLDDWEGGSLVASAPSVATVTVSPASASIAVGSTRQLTAVTRDSSGNVLTGRAVSWSSSNAAAATVDANGLVTAVAADTTTITATSEGQTGRSSITVNPATSPSGPLGPLRVSSINPRYFADPSGRIAYLTGSEYWKTIQDDGPSNPPPAFNYSAFLDFLQSHNHNFTRLYMWEQARWSAETSLSHWFSPTLYVRTGPGVAADGGLKFDLNRINPDYLARVRQRAIDAGARGIYVSVMLFDGWSLGFKGSSTAANPWLAHPFNAANNVNGINGDPNGDGSGFETQTLSIAAITALQDAYVRAVVDAVNDLDNVIYEISNESEQSADAWQYHMIDLIRSYEAGKPKQHPIGMTVPYPTVPQGTNSDVLNSTADWVSMNGDPGDPAPATGNKVSLWDTDHLCGICGDVAWVWKSLTRGHNPLLMDGYDGSAGVGDPKYNPTDPIWESIRKNMGYARSYALRIDLARAVPHGELASSGYCLAKPGSQYLVYSTGGANGVIVNLAAVPASVNLTVEWFNTSTGVAKVVGTVAGGTYRRLTPPSTGGSVVFLY